MPTSARTRPWDRLREEWTEIPVPAIVDEDTFDRVAGRLADNKRFASRNAKVPSQRQGLAACASCGYGYYRASTRTTNKRLFDHCRPAQPDFGFFVRRHVVHQCRVG
jgi:hypothetical protein